ncbi:MAG: type II secretion system F family protein [Planctomycetota bacterium]|nr:type II secretion system F family protein [Planctomycetota bacterium]
MNDMHSHDTLVHITAAFSALAAGLLAYQLLRITNLRTVGAAHDWQFDEQRLLRVRAGNATFRLFEPLIREMADRRWLHSLGGLERVTRYLASGCESLPWKPREYLATKAFESLLVAIIGIAAALRYASVRTALMLAAVSWLVMLHSTISSLKKRAHKRIQAIQLRLPFAVDLMALMMESGSTFHEALKTVVQESDGHAIHTELARVEAGLRRGLSTREALQGLRERVPSQNVDETVFAINRAEELGTPLSKMLLNLAEKMRLRRSQWAERVAGEAQTKMAFPALVVMSSCLLIIIAPFVLEAIAGEL